MTMTKQAGRWLGIGTFSVLSISTVAVVPYLHRTPPTLPTNNITQPLPPARSPLQADDEEPVRRPFDFYTEAAEGELFSPPAVAPQSVRPSVPMPQPAPSPVSNPVAPPVPVPDPFADYACTGIVSIDGHREALMENVKTHEGWYVQPGSVFQGASVVAVGSESVTLLKDGRERLLSRSTAYNLVPLDRSAASSQTGLPSAVANTSYTLQMTTSSENSTGMPQILNAIDGMIFSKHIMDQNSADQLSIISNYVESKPALQIMK